MAVINQDRNTNYREHQFVNVPVQAGQIIYKGTIVAVDSAGNAGMYNIGPGASRVVGVAYEQVDNRLGVAGNVRVQLRRGCHKMANNGSITTAVWAQNRAPFCVATDNQTVAFGGSAMGSTSTNYCGQIVEVEPDGVWVNFNLE
jgi:hypothetical protein